MFRKLRNHFILINLATTSVILIAAFSTVYIVAKNSADTRTPLSAEISVEFSENPALSNNASFLEYLKERVLADRAVALHNLLFVLIVTGLAVEVFVAVFSYFFAEEAIKPVKEAYEAQKIFIANASHEIKTPVAAIKANLEAADLSDENHWIKNIELEADKIESLNLALLRLAKTDAIKEAVISEETELKPLVESTIASFDSRVQKKKVALKTRFALKDKTCAKLNPADFREILEILLDNAIKYCDKKISVSVTPKSLSVKNDGTAIPAENLPHVFDRFYQVDKSANGSGLGLAIAHSLANRNGWKLTAASQKTPKTVSTVFALEF